MSRDTWVANYPPGWRFTYGTITRCGAAFQPTSVTLPAQASDGHTRHVRSRDTPATTKSEPTRQLAQGGTTIEKHISTVTSVSERTSVSATIEAYFVFALVAWGLVIAAPFLPNTSGLLGTLCLAAGMALAWRLNRRERILGPFPSSN